MRSASWLPHVARHSFCKTCIGRYNTGVLRSHSVRRQTAMRGTLPKVTHLTAWYLRSGTRREWERSARARKERARGTRLRRDLYLFQRVSHTLGHVRRGRSRSLNDISSRQYAVMFRYIRRILVGWRPWTGDTSRFWKNGRRGINLGSLEKRDYRTSS